MIRYVLLVLAASPALSAPADQPPIQQFVQSVSSLPGQIFGQQQQQQQPSQFSLSSLVPAIQGVVETLAVPQKRSYPETAAATQVPNTFAQEPNKYYPLAVPLYYVPAFFFAPNKYPAQANPSAAAEKAAEPHQQEAQQYNQNEQQNQGTQYQQLERFHLVGKGFFGTVVVPNQPITQYPGQQQQFPAGTTSQGAAQIQGTGRSIQGTQTQVYPNPGQEVQEQVQPGEKTSHLTNPQQQAYPQQESSQLYQKPQDGYLSEYAKPAIAAYHQAQNQYPLENQQNQAEKIQSEAILAEKVVTNAAGVTAEQVQHN